MLEFAQIEAGNYILNIETINLNNIITNCIDANRESALEKKLSIKTNFSKKKDSSRC